MAQFSTLNKPLICLVVLLAGSALAADSAERRDPGTTTLVDCFIDKVPGFIGGAKPSVSVIKACVAQLEAKRSVFRRGEEVEDIVARDDDVDVSDYILEGGKKNEIVS